MDLPLAHLIWFNYVVLSLHWGAWLAAELVIWRPKFAGQMGVEPSVVHSIRLLAKAVPIRHANRIIWGLCDRAIALQPADALRICYHSVLESGALSRRRR